MNLILVVACSILVTLLLVQYAIVAAQVLWMMNNDFLHDFKTKRDFITAIIPFSLYVRGTYRLVLKFRKMWKDLPDK